MEARTTSIDWEAPVRLEGQVDVWNNEIAVVGDHMVALSRSSTDGRAWTVVRTSSDGVRWQVATTLDGVRLHSLAGVDDRFVAVGSRDGADGRGLPVAATSADGRQWQVTTLGCVDTGVAYDVAETATGLVAVGSTSSHLRERPATWSSTDGVTWRAGSTAGFGEDFASLRHVATAGSTVVAVGALDQDHGLGAQRAWWSDDGHRWQASTSPPLWDQGVLTGDMASGPVGAVLVGAPYEATGSPRAWLTADGRSWQTADLPTLPGAGTSFPGDVASLGGRWVAVSADVIDVGPDPGRHPGIWISDDAATWRRVQPTDLAGPALRRLTDARTVVVRDDRWFVYGTTTPEVDSPTGVEWVLWRGR